jgi:histidinol-phosphate phosphatase family protein
MIIKKPMTLSEKWGINQDWTLFLDRDGVINVRLIDDYVRTMDAFEFLPGVPEAIAQLSKIFKTIVIVTNQQGIGKGLMQVADLELIHKKMKKELESNGGRIDGIYFCPFLEKENSVLRKPNIGMAELAQADFKHIQFDKSIMVGDSKSDMQFGRNAGMKNVFVNTDGIDIDLELFDEIVEELWGFVKRV